jgi:cytoskeletal protein CcmA (bactofilin family)
MWSKPSQAEAPGQAPKSPVVPFTPPVASVPSLTPGPRGGARLGASLQIKGHITGTEDLQIDGRVDGPISLKGHELTVGPSAQLTSEVHARDIVVFGKVTGNVFAKDRVDIKRDGCIVGDIASSRISIEDGAQFRGRIEIDPAKSQAAAD